MVRVLQIGSENWASRFFDATETIEWVHTTGEDLAELDLLKELKTYDLKKEEERIAKILNPKQKAPAKKLRMERYDLVFVTDSFDTMPDLELLDRLISPHTLYFLKQEVKDEHLITFLKKKMAVAFKEHQFLELVRQVPKAFFPGQFGSKMLLKNVDINQQFKGDVFFNGNQYIQFKGQYGQDWTVLATWRQELALIKGRPFELWLEYHLDQTCELQLQVLLMSKSNLGAVEQTWVFGQKELENPVYVDFDHDDAELIFIVSAKGGGELQLGCLHFRFSRLSFGHLALGDGRLVDQNRQEINYYFNPGDLKPPLNVYFSGYSPAQGFEGYRMLLDHGAPFLLISDPRLEGGAFYLGSEELEGKLQALIEKSLDWLGFTTDDLILSGMSMGTFGALYYGARLLPKAIIVGKPLVNLGTVATNEKRNRPLGFGTSLDLLQMFTADEEKRSHEEQLNQRFWTVFNQADFSKTSIAMAYMKHDDYDMSAYWDILDALKGKTVQVFGKGWEGRHNDNTDAIANWFILQHKRLLKEEFGR